MWLGLSRNTLCGESATNSTLRENRQTTQDQECRQSVFRACSRKILGRISQVLWQRRFEIRVSCAELQPLLAKETGAR